MPTTLFLARRPQQVRLTELSERWLRAVPARPSWAEVLRQAWSLAMLQEPAPLALRLVAQQPEAPERLRQAQPVPLAWSA